MSANNKISGSKRKTGSLWPLFFIVLVVILGFLLSSFISLLKVDVPDVSCPSSSTLIQYTTGVNSFSVCTTGDDVETIFDAIAKVQGLSSNG